MASIWGEEEYTGGGGGGGGGGAGLEPQKPEPMLRVLRYSRCRPRGVVPSRVGVVPSERQSHGSTRASLDGNIPRSGNGASMEEVQAQLSCGVAEAPLLVAVRPPAGPCLGVAGPWSCGRESSRSRPIGFTTE